MKNYLKNLRLVILPIIILLFGQISSKYGMLLYGNGKYVFSVPEYLPFLILGYFLLFLRGVIWINVLKQIELSVAYPLTSLSIVFVMISSFFLFKEEITWNKLIGCLLIISGGIYITKSKK